jgi:flagellar hook-length control protein FliK
MMNLNINLTLGSPGAESLVNTAPSSEDETGDSFSLKLADELSEQELTPSLLLDDTRAIDPALLELIAARQKVAADAETTTTKDGRVWLDDPLAGLPGQQDIPVEVVGTAEDDKPWLDIIEKAKSYSPALQANKIAGDSPAEASVFQDLSAPIVDDVLTSLVGDAATALLTEQAGVVSTVADAASLEVASDHTADISAAATGAVHQADPQQSAVAVDVVTAEQLKTASQNSVTELPVDQPDVMTQVRQSPDTFSATNNAPVAVLTEAVDAQPTARPTDGGPEVKVVAALAGQEFVVDAKTDAKTDEFSAQLAFTSADPVTEPTKVTAASAQSAKIPEQALKTSDSVQPTVLTSDSALNQQQPSADPLQQALQANEALAGAGSIYRPGLTTTAGTDKAPAANAFAEHLKAVNQTQQQQQQQSGAEQQPGQGQAKASVEAMLTNLAAQPAQTAPAFVQQLQQVQQATEASLPQSAVVQPLTQAATTSASPALLSARPADSVMTWQTPLTLTEPGAAQQLKDRVMVQIQQKLQTAEVQLYPEELGSIQIKMNLQQDQLSVQFVVQQQAAKEALEQQMPKLRDLLEEQGITLTEGQVEQRQSGAQQEQRQARSGQAGSDEADLATVQTVQMRVSDRMVDFYA